MATKTCPVLPPELVDRYEANPLAVQSEVRQRYGIREDQYFTVTTFPPHLRGRLHLDLSRTRDLPKHKISKSDQKEGA